MSTTQIRGFVRSGRVETDEPIDLPDGTPLVISVRNGKAEDREDDYGTSEQAIADWLSWCDALEPLQITREEQADTDHWLRKSNEHRPDLAELYRRVPG